MSPKCVPSLLPPLYDAPPVDQVEDKEEEREQAEENHVGPAVEKHLGKFFSSVHHHDATWSKYFMSVVSLGVHVNVNVNQINATYASVG